MILFSISMARCVNSMQFNSYDLFIYFFVFSFHNHKIAIDQLTTYTMQQSLFIYFNLMINTMKFINKWRLKKKNK